MTPFWFTIATFGFSVLAGIVGSLLGLGGGIIVIPVLTQIFGIDMRLAIGASIVSVIATSSGAAVAYLRERMTNFRVAMFLELATTAGALSGAYLSGLIPSSGLKIVFGVVLGYSALVMLRHRRELAGEPPPDRLADSLRLHGSYYDEVAGREISYRVTHSRLGLALMYLAGLVSGLLGIGSGAMKVPAMDLAMRLPIKVSSATSNFMIGVTAAASAGVYFARGHVNPFIAAPVATGVLLGAAVGPHLLKRLASDRVRLVFVVVLIYIAVHMLWVGAKGMHGHA